MRRRRYSGLPSNRPGPTAGERRRAERRARRFARDEQVVALRAAGWSTVAIAREARLDRRTVATWLAAGQFPGRATRRPPPRLAAAFADVIAERYGAGLDNARQLAREFAARGFRGSDQSVRRALARLRVTRPRATSTSAPPPRPTITPAPSPRETAWLLRRADDTPESLSTEEQASVARRCDQCPALARARALATDFARMCRARDPTALAPWLAAAGGSELRTFAAGLERDRDAVLAALCFRWSNGQVEGQVDRLKLLKRSRYGRAKFDLLRKRMLHAA